MSSTFNLSAKGWFPIGLVVCILAAFDSAHVHLCYKTWLPYGPAGLFVVCALIWPFATTWYSIVRVRFARDTMPVREAFVQNPP